jgi:hypothetical protein
LTLQRLCPLHALSNALRPLIQHPKQRWQSEAPQQEEQYPEVDYLGDKAR